MLSPIDTTNAPLKTLTMKKILLVCLGNTCRSPMAESVMKHWITQNGLNWKVDSAGLRTWNVGKLPNELCLKVLQENGMTSQHLGRMITPEDFYEFDYILGMDEHNIRELNELSEAVHAENEAKIELLGSYLHRFEDRIIPDPYFSGNLGTFRSVFSQINESCKNFINEHKQKQN